MFFLLALLATFGYALNNTLMASYYRSMDQWWAVTLRGVGLAVTMLPLLLLPTREELWGITGEWPLLVTAAGLALVGNWCAANAMRHLPVGIASALNSSAAVVATAGYGYQFAGEKLTAFELVWMAFLVAGVMALGATKVTPPVHGSFHVKKGALSSLGFGISLGLGYTLIGILTRRAHPLVVGYCWETTIGLFGMIVLAVRRVYLGPSGPRIVFQEVGTIILYSIPAAVGTGCYAAAVARGPVAIVSAVLASAMIATSLFAWLMYREKLTRIQWGLVVLVAGLVVGLRLSGS